MKRGELERAREFRRERDNRKSKFEREEGRSTEVEEERA